MVQTAMSSNRIDRTLGDTDQRNGSFIWHRSRPSRATLVPISFALKLVGTFAIVACGDSSVQGDDPSDMLPSSKDSEDLDGDDQDSTKPSNPDDESTKDSDNNTSDTDEDDEDPGESSKSELPKFDLMLPDAIEPESGGSCDVDLLFIIDNSASMDTYQQAIGLAFPRFAQSLRTALPNATNVHVGVTSTEMGYSSSGSTMGGAGGCTFTGDNGADYTTFYVPPTQTNTGRNGAQGRLYQPSGHPAFFDIDMSADDAEFAKLADWFISAAAVGTGGSNIEMLTAPAGWVSDPANSGTNAGFIRDSETVMVTFFIQDEPDQTPSTIDGQAGGEAMLKRLVAAKKNCGGLECIVAGGFTNIHDCGGTRPIKEFIDGLTRPAAVAPLPDGEDAESIADAMNQLLSTTLLEVIQETCEAIVPPG